MATEKFITVIHEKKCLWDQSESDYHSRYVQRMLWKEVATEMSMPVENAKKKWRGLRDTFRRELKKATANISGEAADETKSSNWPYFKNLLFLGDSMNPRKFKTSVQKNIYWKTFPEISIDDPTISRAFDSGDSLSSPSPAKILTSTGIFKSPLKNKQRRHMDYVAKILEIEEKKLKCLEQNSNDSDCQFLMSLLPYLKDIPQSRKLIIRAKLQQVFIDEDHTQDTT